MIFYFFFFQAEDGIRDGHVTGVQTCALPIFHQCESGGVQADDLLSRAVSLHPAGFALVERSALGIEAELAERLLGRVARSEERRVGKGGRCWVGGGRGTDSKKCDVWMLCGWR